MSNEYAIALPQRPRGRTRSRRRVRYGGLFKLMVLGAAAFLAAAFIVPAIWRGLAGGRASGQYRNVEIVYQNPELPNGCEAASLAMLLTSAGCPADKLALYRDYLPKADFSQIDGRRYGPNPEKWYAGNAADLKGGWYCFEGPVVQAANGWLEDHGSAARARSVTGLSRAELERYAQDGVPLAVWVTLAYDAPRYSEFSWTLEDGMQYHPYSNLHCVVLAGERDGQYQTADPIIGLTLVDKDLFWDSFSAMGSRAVVVE